MPKSCLKIAKNEKSYSIFPYKISHLFPFVDSNLTETAIFVRRLSVLILDNMPARLSRNLHAKKLLRKAKIERGCQERKELLQTPNVAHKLPSTIGTRLRCIVRI